MQHRHVETLARLNDHLNIAAPLPKAMTAAEYAERVAASLARVRNQPMRGAVNIQPSTNQR